MIRNAGIKPTDRILDIGCGDGKITADMANIVTQGQVLGTDISAQMIQFATRTYTQNNLGFMVMDAEINVFRKQFELVTSFCCLHWVRRQLTALKGIKSALVDNGRAVLLVPLRHEELYSAIESVVGSEKWNQFFVGFVNPHVFFTKEEYNQLLIDAELSPLSLDEKITPYTFRTKDEMEKFLKAWLPHIKRLPNELHDEFMTDIGNKFLEQNPQESNSTITLPLRMLQAHALQKKQIPVVQASLYETKSSALYKKQICHTTHSEKQRILSSKL
jgi:ubiquinone/menaquinone biosynthesis C-methylase UbiE